MSAQETSKRWEEAAHRDALPHYQSTGAALMLLGGLNSFIALFLMRGGVELSFIDPVAMIAFGLSFVATGYWMRSLKRLG